MNIRRRLEALERCASHSGDISILTILGGLPEAFRKNARAGPHQWLQDPGESLYDFRDRVVKLAKARGESFLLIGGLPDDDIGDAPAHSEEVL